MSGIMETCTSTGTACYPGCEKQQHCPFNAQPAALPKAATFTRQPVAPAAPTASAEPASVEEIMEAIRLLAVDMFHHGQECVQFRDNHFQVKYRTGSVRVHKLIETLASRVHDAELIDAVRSGSAEGRAALLTNMLRGWFEWDMRSFAWMILDRGKPSGATEAVVDAAVAWQHESHHEHEHPDLALAADNRLSAAVDAYENGAGGQA